MKKIIAPTRLLLSLAVGACFSAQVHADAAVTAAALGGVFGFAATKMQGSSVDLGVSQYGVVKYQELDCEKLKQPHGAGFISNCEKVKLNVLSRFDNSTDREGVEANVVPGDVVNVYLKNIVAQKDA
ncbi:MAG: hypothetical protein RIR00_1053, partial [Pseudomonadota bacterium]